MKIKNLFKINLDLKNRTFGLDLMRATAIIIVILIHGDLIVREQLPNFPSFNIIDGVDLFFVLSGFLIGSILLKIYSNEEYKYKSVIYFWKRRWYRTLPNYFLVLILITLYTTIICQCFNHWIPSYLVFLQNFYHVHPQFYGVAWSLSVEEWFYIFLPVTLLILHSIFPKISKKNIFFITILIFIIFPTLYRLKKGLFFAYGEHPEDIWLSNFRQVVLARLDTPMLGVLGAFVKFYYPKLWKAIPNTLFVLGIIILFIVTKYFDKGLFYFVFYFNFTALGMLFFIPKLDSIKSVNKYIAIPITYISIISYSLYLLHTTLILSPFLEHYKPQSISIAIVIYISYFIISILLSTLFYKFFEKPFMDLREKK